MIQARKTLILFFLKKLCPSVGKNLGGKGKFGTIDHLEEENLQKFFRLDHPMSDLTRDRHRNVS